jgi:hypothetical protein
VIWRGVAAIRSSQRRIPGNGQIKSAIGSCVSIGVKRDVGDRERIAGQPIGAPEPVLHDGQCPVACLQKLRHAFGGRFSTPRRVAAQRPVHRDRRLVIVLLEEQLLVHFCPVIRIARNEIGRFAEIEQDRIRLGEKPAVVELDRGHQIRISTQSCCSFAAKENGRGRFLGFPIFPGYVEIIPG